MGKLQRFCRPKTVQVTRNTLSTETLISKHVYLNKTSSISTHWKNKRSTRLNFTKHPLYRIATTVSITLSLMHLFITDQGLLTSRLWIFVLKKRIKIQLFSGTSCSSIQVNLWPKKSPGKKRKSACSLEYPFVSTCRIYGGDSYP